MFHSAFYDFTHPLAAGLNAFKVLLVTFDSVPVIKPRKLFVTRVVRREALNENYFCACKFYINRYFQFCKKEHIILLTISKQNEEHAFFV